MRLGALAGPAAAPEARVERRPPPHADGRAALGAVGVCVRPLVLRRDRAVADGGASRPASRDGRAAPPASEPPSTPSSICAKAASTSRAAGCAASALVVDLAAERRSRGCRWSFSAASANRPRSPEERPFVAPLRRSAVGPRRRLRRATVARGRAGDRRAGAASARRRQAARRRQPAYQAARRWRRRAAMGHRARIDAARRRRRERHHRPWVVAGSGARRTVPRLHAVDYVVSEARTSRCAASAAARRRRRRTSRSEGRPGPTPRPLKIGRRCGLRRACSAEAAAGRRAGVRSDVRRPHAVVGVI